MIKKICVSVILSTALVSLYAQSIPSQITPFMFPSARFNATGGTHVAVTDDFYTLFSNPAGFASIEDVYSYSELSIDIKDFDTFFNLYFGEGASLGTVITNNLHAGADLGGPLALGRIDQGYGWGIFNASRMNVLWQPTNVGMVNVFFSEEIILAGGMAHRFGDVGSWTFDVGFLGKFFFRGQLENEDQLQGVRYFFENVANYRFQTHLGVGLDLGLNTTWANAFSFGLVLYDLLAPALVNNYADLGKFALQRMLGAGMSEVTRRIDFGFAWRIKDPPFAYYISELIIMGDYSGLSEIYAAAPRDPMLDIGVGLEIRLLEALALRAGFFDMLPSFGVGVNMTYWQFDAAFYGEELGTSPGVFPTYSLALSISFRY